MFYQTIKSLTADQCNLVQNSRDHYHKFGKTQMLVFLFFLCFWGIKKKQNINIFVYHAHGFTQNFFFFCVSSLSSENIIKNTYLHIFSNCDYFSDWYWMTIYSQPRKCLLSIMNENINLQQNDDNLLHSFFISLFNPEVWFKVLTHIQINYLSSKLKDVLKSIHVYILMGNSLNIMCHSVRVYQATILMSEIEAY